MAKSGNNGLSIQAVDKASCVDPRAFRLQFIVIAATGVLYLDDLGGCHPCFASTVLRLLWLKAAYSGSSAANGTAYPVIAVQDSKTIAT